MGAICRAAMLIRVSASGGASICGQWRTSFRFPQVPSLERRCFSVKSSLEPPDVAKLAQTARISLTQQEIEEFAPKIQQVVEWFGQLQGVDLESVEPAIRADSEGDNVREDLSEVFENGRAIVDGIPSYEEPYIKVPKVLNKE